MCMPRACGDLFFFSEGTILLALGKSRGSSRFLLASDPKLLRRRVKADSPARFEVMFV